MRKRREYFQAGVRMVWMVDRFQRTVAVYSTADKCFVANEEQTIDGGPVLPEWKVELGKLFAELDRKQ